MQVTSRPDISLRPEIDLRLKQEKAQKWSTRCISCRGRLMLFCLRLGEAALLGSLTVLVQLQTGQSHASIRNARGWQKLESIARHDFEQWPFMTGCV